MVAREYNSASPASPPQGCVNERLEKGPREVVLDGRHQRGVASAEGCLEDLEGISACDTRARYMTSDASRLNREPDRASGEESVGCVERISSDGRSTALTQRPETTRTASLFREAVVEPRVDSDYRRIVDGEDYSSGCTELQTQAAEALMLFDVTKEDTTTVGGTAYDQGVGVGDWLDVTHAMLSTNANGLGPDLV